ncbi:MAG: ABC transporter permease [Gemmatimonadota bacterium]|nr:ABC transporter permease [Gemmatimonadota bacterium]
MSETPGERWYRRLLALYPARFRERFGDEMLELFRDRERRGGEHATRWPRLLLDVLSTAPLEHAHDVARRRRERRDATMSRSNPQMGDGMLWSIRHDIRYALRGMLRKPAFSAVVLLTLSLGIGANAAIFAVVNGILLRPLPYRDAARIVHFEHTDPYWSVSEPEFMDYKRDMRSFELLAAYNTGDVSLTGGDEPARVEVARVSNEFFHVLGVQPQVGRTFTPDEYASKGGSVIVLSDAVWRARFGADRHMVGKDVMINGRPRTVIGIMPPRFDYPASITGIWSPMRLNPDSLWTRNNHYLSMVGKLALGTSVERARVEAMTLERRWMKDFPETYFPGKPLLANMSTITDSIIGSTRPFLLALLGAVAFVLLIACVNVANLLLARGESRRKELAIRTALGASRRRLVRQVLTESALYAIGGGALGIALAWWGQRLLIAAAPTTIPRLGEIHMDATVLAFTFVVSLATGMLFGLVPALRGSRDDSADTLKEGGKTSTTGTGFRTARGVLVVAEVALAVVMLTGAGLMLRSLWKLQGTDLGFDPSRVLTMQIALPLAAYPEGRTIDFFQDLTTRVEAMPGVRAAAAVRSLPIGGGGDIWSIQIDGRVVKVISEAPSAAPQQVTPDYFKALSIPILRGRRFLASDRVGAPYVAMVNETMAKQLWPGKDPVGHTIRMFDTTAMWATVVGVVKDVRSRGLEEEIPPTMYFPHAQAGKTNYGSALTMSLVIHTAGDPALAAGAVRAAVRAIDKNVPVSQVRTMDEVVAGSIASRRFSTTLLAAFALLALVLAGIGIYGVIAYSVSQRTYEIGLRMALGAQRGSVMRLVLTQGMRMTAIGLAIGIVGAIAIMRLLRSMLVSVSVLDLPTLGTVSLALAAVAALACLLPARRAVDISPTEALRSE